MIEYITNEIAYYRSNIDCNKIIEYFEIINGFEEVNYRPHLTYWMNYKENENDSQEVKYIRSVIKNDLFPVFHEYLTNQGVESYCHRPRYLCSKMLPGKYMESHQDPIKAYAYDVYLNDNFTGGQLIFDNLNLSITPEPGMLLMFRPYEMHHVTTLHDGPRYSYGSGITRTDKSDDYFGMMYN